MVLMLGRVDTPDDFPQCGSNGIVLVPRFPPGFQKIPKRTETLLLRVAVLGDDSGEEIRPLKS